MKRKTVLLTVVLVLPVQSLKEWHHLEFPGIRQNVVSADRRGLTIKVDKSSSPLFYLLPKSQKVKSVHAKGILRGLPHLPEGIKEGVLAADDYALRIGLAYEGEGVGWLRKMFAPAWIKQMLALRPDNQFDGIRFYNIAQKSEIRNRRRHPNSAMVEEEVALKMTSPGPFDFEYPNTDSPSTLGVWVHADGDDTKSTFELLLTEIGLTLEE